MKRWLPLLLGFIVGIMAGTLIVSSPGGMEAAQGYYGDSIRRAFYAHKDPLIGLAIDPIVVIAFFGAVGVLLALMLTGLYFLIRFALKLTRHYEARAATKS